MLIQRFHYQWEEARVGLPVKLRQQQAALPGNEVFAMPDEPLNDMLRYQGPNGFTCRIGFDINRLVEQLWFTPDDPLFIGDYNLLLDPDMKGKELLDRTYLPIPSLDEAPNDLAAYQTTDVLIAVVADGFIKSIGILRQA